METWSQLKEHIRQWSRCEISDDLFYEYLTTHNFEFDADQRVVDIFIEQHDNGEWSHAIYHRL